MILPHNAYTKYYETKAHIKYINNDAGNYFFLSNG
jgi:hypothetical protein